MCIRINDVMGIFLINLILLSKIALSYFRIRVLYYTMQCLILKYSLNISTKSKVVLMISN